MYLFIKYVYKILIPDTNYFCLMNISLSITLVYFSYLGFDRKYKLLFAEYLHNNGLLIKIFPHGE